MSDLFSLKGRNALITGASAGLGQHFAMTLARAGAKVVLAARRMEKLHAVAAEIESTGGNALPVVMDVTDADSARIGFTTAQEALGTISIIVNNAGVTTVSSALALTENDWYHVIDTNLKGAWLVAREAARRLVEVTTAGSIINIVSILATRVAGNLSAYAASKAGLEHLTRAMALEWARHNIRVNAIAPGYILTDINREFFQSPAGGAMVKRIPQRRIGTPKDLDGALLLLASDASRYMTGSTIVVDGGHLQSSL